MSGDVYGDVAAWATGDGRRFDRATVANVTTGKTAVAVHAATGHIDLVRIHGNTLVYRELSGRPDDGDKGDWAIKTITLDSKAAATIAKSQQPTGNIPLPVISGAAIAWVEGEDGDQQLRVFDRATSATRTVFRGPEITSVQLDAARVFFVDATDDGRPVLTVPISGGTPSKLIPLAKAIQLRISATHVAYTRGPDANSDPDGLVIYDRATKTSTTITDSTTSMFALGDSFIAWHPLGEDRLLIATLVRGAPQIVLQSEHVNVPLRLAARGDLLLWGESMLVPNSNPTKFTNRVFMARVRPARHSDRDGTDAGPRSS